MKRLTCTLAALAMLIWTCTPAQAEPYNPATGAEFAKVIGVSYRTPNPTIDIVVALLKGIDNAARQGNADFGLRVTVTYVSVNDTIETLDSGRLSIKTDTTFLSKLDNRTVSVLLQSPLGATPLPGGNPSFSATVQLLQRDPTTAADDEVAPAELSFPGEERMGPSANVIEVSFRNGFPTIDAVVAILKGIDNASRNGNADFGLRVTITYVSTNDTIETVDSGRLSIKNNTTFLAAIDNRLVSVLLQVPLGTHPGPGNNPSFSATVEIFHMNAATAPTSSRPAETFPA